MTPERSPVTARAVAIGLFLAVGVNLVQLYNDYYLANTPLILNHLPTAGMAVLLALVAYNVTAGRRTGTAFAPGEMLLIWCMTAIGGGIGATGFGRCIIGFLASPAYLSTPSNDFLPYLVNPLPAWAVVSKDPDSPVLRWYFEGLPRGQRLPWEAWARPLAAWIGFFVAGYCVMFALTSLLYRQWADRERLTFPIAFVPEATAAAAAPGRALNDFLRNRVTWMGAAVPLLIHGWNGARNYAPGLPEIPLHFGTWGLFADRPWNAFDLGWAHVWFAIVGLAFLLTVDVSFSLWFCFVLYHLSFVFTAWLGAGGQGYFGNWTQSVAVLQSSGGILVMAAFLLWTARAPLRAWWGRMRRGEDAPDEDLLPPRLSLVLLAAGFLGLVLFTRAHGAQWWAALLGMALYAAVILFLTRLVAEAGMLLVGVEAIGYEFLHNVFPAKWLTAGTLTTFVQLRGGVMSDLRELLMPYLMNGVRLCAATGRHARAVLLVFAVTVAVALAAACFGRIATAYKFGAAIGDAAYNGGWQGWLYPDLVNRLKNPKPVNMIQAGDVAVMPAGVAHVLTGAGLTGAMLLLRAKFMWWVPNPIGYLVCGSWPITEIWFSVFLGWLARFCVMTFLGTTGYRRLLPFFLGLVLGQAVIATFWTAVSFATGTPGVYMMPN